MEQTFKRLNTITGWVIFIIAMAVYTFTLEPTVSFWDCGEFISGAYKLEVVHPPGAPFFLMLGRVFISLFSFGDVERVAWAVNFMSGTSTAFAVLFLFWTITHLAKRIVFKDGEISMPRILVVLFAGVVGALSSTFLDTQWFSAVEGEVYALSLFFMSFGMWAILKWEESNDEYEDRWLLLIAFSLGLATGVHLLSLLIVPILALVIYLKKYKPTLLGGLIAFAVGFAVILIFIQKIIIAGIPWLAASLDKLFVNSMNLPFNSGAFFAIFLLVAACAYGIYYTHKKGLTEWNKIVLAVVFILIGYSTYMMVPIRANINPPINMNKPGDPFRMLSYLNREQYGERPLLFGPQYTADPSYDRDQSKEGGVNVKGAYIYKLGERYEKIDDKLEIAWSPDVKTFFPRMGFPGDGDKRQAFRYWIKPGAKIIDRGSGNKVVKELDFEYLVNKHGDYKNAAEQELKEYKAAYPNSQLSVVDDISWGDNFAFFTQYQIGYMYMRYFMWNFAGRQNNDQGYFRDNEANGGWICGIPFIDNTLKIWGHATLPQTDMPAVLADHKAHNKFYLLPLLFGLIGLAWMFTKNKEVFSIVVFLFIFTGVLQVIYHNQPPVEPRERDYVFVGSFFAYTIWIGFGVLAIFDLLRTRFKLGEMPAAVAGFVICLTAPLLMGIQGWDDHDRSEKFTARDFALDYLESCAPNAILFTQGDNDTYPLWYATEVEGIRSDVRVINLSLLGVDWYADQLYFPVNENAPLNLMLDPEDLFATRNQYTYYNENPGKFPSGKFHDVSAVMEFLTSDNKDEQFFNQRSGEWSNYLPTRNLSIPLDLEKVQEMDMVSPEDYDKIEEIRWTLNTQNLTKSELITLDIIANNFYDRPIYFCTTVDWRTALGLEPYFQQEGLAFRIVPIKYQATTRDIDPKTGLYYPFFIRDDAMYDRVMNTYQWGGMEMPGNYMDPESLRVTYNFREMFVRLAYNLLQENKLEKAEAVVDKCVEVMPQENVPYTHSLLNVFRNNVQYLAALYYRIGEEHYLNDNMEAANRNWEKSYTIAKALGEECASLLGYYSKYRDDAYANQMNKLCREQFVYLMDLYTQFGMDRLTELGFQPSLPRPSNTGSIVETQAGQTAISSMANQSEEWTFVLELWEMYKPFAPVQGQPGQGGNPS